MVLLVQSFIFFFRFAVEFSIGFQSSKPVHAKINLIIYPFFGEQHVGPLFNLLENPSRILNTIDFGLCGLEFCGAHSSRTSSKLFIRVIFEKHVSDSEH
jgi:hypothetical protein